MMIGTEDTSEQNHHYRELTRSRQPHQTAICCPVVMTRLSCIDMMFFFLRRSHCLRFFPVSSELTRSHHLEIQMWTLDKFKSSV